MKILKIIFRLPLLPFIILFIIYVLIKILINTDMTEMAIKEEKGEEFLTPEFKNHYEEKLKKYDTHINAINLILWLTFIMFMMK